MKFYLSSSHLNFGERETKRKAQYFCTKHKLLFLWMLVQKEELHGVLSWGMSLNLLQLELGNKKILLPRFAENNLTYSTKEL